MKKLFVLISVVALVAGCSTSNDVAMNADYQNAVAASEKARMEAIGRIALQGEMGAVAAAMMLSQDRGNTHSAPRSGGDTALAWAGVIAPVLTTGLGVAVNGAVTVRQSDNNKVVALNQSNNSADVTMDTNATMAGIAEVTIVNPEVVTPTVVCVIDATYTCD
jgi:uncharacterized lipoprotein